jgi:Lrp/AsnC family leucine-responsive transcriptional regulator
VDDVDRQILLLLGENARRTFGDIGSHVGLTAPAIKRRVDRLERTGVIQSYTAVINPALLGQTLEAVVELRFAGRTRVHDIENIAPDVPQIRAIFTVAGDPDALAWIRVGDVQELKTVVDQLRNGAEITGTKTLIVLDRSTRANDTGL